MYRDEEENRSLRFARRKIPRAGENNARFSCENEEERALENRVARFCFAAKRDDAKPSASFVTTYL